MLGTVLVIGTMYVTIRGSLVALDIVEDALRGDFQRRRYLEAIALGICGIGLAWVSPVSMWPAAKVGMAIALVLFTVVKVSSHGARRARPRR